MPTLNPRAAHVAVLAIVAFATVLHLGTRRPGHGWGGDFAQYIRHAENLLDEAPYGATSEVFHSDGRVRPVVYPPVLPVLLAPVRADRELDIEAMKAVLVLVLALGALAVYAYALRRIGPAGAVLVAGLFVLNPFVWRHKDHILSELPFLLFVFLALLAAGGGAVDESRGDRRSAALGVTAYLAFATRTVGVALIGALVVDELWRGWRERGRAVAPSRGLWIAVGVAVALAALQSVTIAGGGGYLADLRPGVMTVLENLLSYVKNWSEFWTSGSEILRAIMFVGTFLLAVRGYFARVRTAPGPAECFIPLYLATGLLWPYDLGPRFLLPIFPLYLVYVVEALRADLPRLPERIGANARVGAFAGIAALAYIGWYATADYGPMDRGPLTADAIGGWEHVRGHTPADAIVVFRKPRVLALFTGRRSARPPSPDSDAFWPFLEDVGADYLMVRTLEDAEMLEYARRRPDRFRPVFANGALELYLIESVPDTTSRSTRR